MTVNFITISLKQLSLSQLTKILTATLLPVDMRIMMGELELVALTNYGYVFCLGLFFVFTSFSNACIYVNTLLGSFLSRVLEGAHRNDGLKIKLNQFNGKSTPDIAHETTYISKICAANYKLSSNLHQEFCFQAR